MAWWCGGEGMWSGKVIFGGGRPAVRERVPYRGRSAGTSPGAIRRGYGCYGSARAGRAVPGQSGGRADRHRADAPMLLSGCAPWSAPVPGVRGDDAAACRWGTHTWARWAGLAQAGRPLVVRWAGSKRVGLTVRHQMRRPLAWDIRGIDADSSDPPKLSSAPARLAPRAPSVRQLVEQLGRESQVDVIPGGQDVALADPALDERRPGLPEGRAPLLGRRRRQHQHDDRRGPRGPLSRLPACGERREAAPAAHASAATSAAPPRRAARRAIAPAGRRAGALRAALRCPLRWRSARALR